MEQDNEQNRLSGADQSPAGDLFPADKPGIDQQRETGAGAPGTPKTLTAGAKPDQEASGDGTAGAKPAPAPPKKKKTRPPKNSLPENSGSSLGSLLKNARTAAAMTIEQASGETHINARHIQALEEDRRDGLPEMVFVRAYVRTLVGLYNLDDHSSALIDGHLQALGPAAVPEKVLEEIEKDVHFSREEARKIKMFLICGVIVLFLLIVLAVLGLVCSGGSKTAKTVPPTPFEVRKLEKLLPPQLPEPKILSVPAPDKKK